MKAPRWALALLLCSIACGSEDPAVELPDVIYEGDASDEALERVWPKIPEAQVSETGGASITAPATGTALPSDPAPTFAWSLPGQRLTLAHLPPVTGDVFLVEFTIPGQNEPLRVFSTERDYIPDGNAWARLKSGAGPVSIKIYNAYLNRNVLEEGPFTRAETVSFTVATQ